MLQLARNFAQLREIKYEQYFVQSRTFHAIGQDPFLA
jgi:hypothetical protein